VVGGLQESISESAGLGQRNGSAVVVVIEERDAAALGFDDVALVINRAPDIGNVESGLAGYFYELHRRRRISWTGRIEQ
jgi:hypothetical protein